MALEALRKLNRDPYWQQIILEECDDALYKGKLPEPTKDSVTVLLPKEALHCHQTHYPINELPQVAQF